MKICLEIVAVAFFAFLPRLEAQVSPSGPDSLTPQLIAPGVWRFHFGEPEQFTPVTFRSAPLLPGPFADLPSCNLPIDPTQIHFATQGTGCSVNLPLSDEEKIYGFGLNTELFEMTSRTSKSGVPGPIVIRPSDHPENPDNYSHAPVPFYVSTAGYGVYVDTARYAAFSPGDAPAESTADASTGKGKTMRVDIPSAHGIDVYIFGGPAMGEAIRRYNLFSGGGCVPPLWGLGMAYRGSAQFKADDVLQLAQSFRDLHMPCDIWGLEPGWQSKSYSCSFAWNTKNFPDPDGFIKKMTDAGYHLNLWEHCFTNPASPIYEALKPFSGSNPVWHGLVPDFAGANARKIFQDYHDQLLFAHGIDGMKLDECDSPAPDVKRPWSFTETTTFPSGLDGEQMHSLLGVLYQQTMWEPLQHRNIRTWGLVRDSNSLAAPLPYTVYSDSYTDRCYLRGLAKEGFGGLLWTPEVRDAKSVEELYRRLEMVIFSPYALVNCWYMKLPPWEQMEKTASNRGEIMANHQEVEDVVRHLFELRMSFIPYLYAAFNEYHLHGTPPLRAMVMDWPADPATAKIDDQFMFGPSILVAPLLKGQTGRSVYLPAGTWHDYWTGETLDGGRNIEVTKPVDQIPLYVKHNTLLPLAAPLEHVAPDTCFELTVRVYGKAPVGFALYEDDGVSYDYEKGKQNRLNLTWRDGQGTAEKSGNYTGATRYRIAKWIAQ
ncbi:MAG TPA: TIM-barrel domain-containing protein [Candidatus Methylacidiphilales bacterium]